MADQLPTKNYYQNLGGINIKASKYELTTAQFLDLRNLDFDVPNALQKRPGQSLWSSASMSGPVLSIWEFEKLLTIGEVPNDYILANANGNIFYNTPRSASNPNAFSLLSSGWGTTQPVNFLTFANKAWMANGQSFGSFDGSTFLSAGMPMQKSTVVSIDANTGGSSYFLVGQATMLNIPSLNGVTFVLRGVYVGYSYIRSDGYQGPADFLNNAKNIVCFGNPASSGSDYFQFGIKRLAGLTVPANQGISAIAIWVACDTVTNTSATGFVAPALSGPLGATYIQRVGNLGYAYNTGSNYRHMSVTMIPNADLSRFHFYTSIPGSSLFLMNGFDGGTYWGCTFSLDGPTFSSWDGVASSDGFSGMTFDFFSSFIPKYIEINQNTMFYSGFSASPSAVKYSEVGQPEYLLPESTFESRTNDGDRVFGIKSFNNQLLILKERSFAKLIGDSADNYQLVSLSNDLGCLSERSIITNDKICFWLDKKGIVMFNGANWEIISEPIEAVFRRMNVASAKETACGVHHLYRNQIWWGVPVDGSTVNNLTIVYDYIVNAWTFFDGFNPASFGYIRGQLTRPTVWRGDYSGSVHFFGESFFNDSGQGITCLAFTRFDSEAQNKAVLWRRLFLDVATASGITGQIKGQMYSNYDQSTVQATFSTYQNQFQTRVEFGVQGKAVAAQFSHFSASLPLLINGYGWASRDLRNV